MKTIEECYFDIEVGYTDNELIERMRKGQKVPFIPENIKIITIQYQFLDESGAPKGPLRIMKEWTSSEENIVRKAASLLKPEVQWETVPVGYNIHFDLGIFRRRAAAFGMDFSEWFIYHELPVIDIKSICLGMNCFKFKNSGLDKFTGKESSGFMIPLWYADSDYDKIIDYIEKETAAFIEFYKKLKDLLPAFREQHGFFKSP